MNWLWTSAAILQCVMLWWLWRGGRQRLAPRHDPGAATLNDAPRAGMIIPAAGTHPNMPAALRSLLRQDYPNLIPVIVTATADEPAADLARTLREEFPALRHVVAGQADGCGQKNHNTLRAIEALGEEPDLYVFCDSTHTAPPGFVRSLLRPIIGGEANFSTGYHMVVAEDDGLITRAYQLCVLLMRLLQAVAVFTQPWGGAMAMRRDAFQRLDLKHFWAGNVVDDCSLAGLLLRRRERVVLCPDALLMTAARAHSLPIWRAWMDRQILFLKFCVPSQWVMLGLFAALMLLTPLRSLLLLFGAGGPAMWLCAAVHLTALAAIMSRWREFLPEGAPLGVWLRGFAASTCMFAWVFLRTIPATGILWHGIYYSVGRGGAVRAMRR